MTRCGSKSCLFGIGCVTAGESLLLPGLSFPIYDTKALFYWTTRSVQVWMIWDSLVYLSMHLKQETLRGGKLHYKSQGISRMLWLDF